MAKQMEAHLQKESKLWSFVVLFQKQIMNARRESKEINLTWRIQEASNCWIYFEYFLESISCILYVFSKLGKSGVQRFKRCVNWSWNEEVMVVWRQPHQVVRKFRSCEINLGLENVVLLLRNFVALLLWNFSWSFPIFATNILRFLL